MVTIEAERDFMITHNFGCYESEDGNTIILDAIVYDDAKAYTLHTFAEEMLYGEKPTNYLMRFTIHLDTSTVEMKLQHNQTEGTWVEFSQINWKFAAEKQFYR